MGILYTRRGWVCPVSNTAGPSQLKWTHHNQVDSGTTEPLGQDSGALGKVCIRKSKTLHGSEEWQEQIGEAAQLAPKSEKEGRRCARCWSRDSPAAMEMTTVEQIFTLQPMEGPVVEKVNIS